jgi:hypothetical protein
MAGRYRRSGAASRQAVTTMAKDLLNVVRSRCIHAWWNLTDVLFMSRSFLPTRLRTAHPTGGIKGQATTTQRRVLPRPMRDR